MRKGGTATHGEMDSRSDSLEPIGATIGRAGAELTKIVQTISDLEDVVGHAIGSASSTRELKIEELQKLDYVRQKIEGAAEFLNALMRDLPKDWLVDAKHAARAVALTDLATRLGGGKPAAHPERALPSVDVYELFD